MPISSTFFGNESMILIGLHALLCGWSYVNGGLVLSKVNAMSACWVQFLDTVHDTSVSIRGIYCFTAWYSVCVSYVEISHLESEEGTQQSDTRWQQCKKILTYENLIYMALDKCNICLSKNEISRTYKGSQMCLKMTCSSDHTSTWNSSYEIRRMSLMNLYCAAATFYTGGTYTDINEFFELMDTACLSERRFYQIQSQYILPSANHPQLLQWTAALYISWNEHSDTRKRTHNFDGWWSIGLTCVFSQIHVIFFHGRKNRKDCWHSVGANFWMQ